MCALGSLSIIGGIQNLISCVKMARSEHLAGSDCARRGIFVKYAVEISDLALFYSRDVFKNKGYRIVGEKQCHSVNKCILFEITCMRSVNRRIVALFYALVMKVLKVRPMVRRKK